MGDNKLTGILIDPVDQTIKTVEFEDELKSYYETLECTMIQEVLLGGTSDGRSVIMYCDEDGRLKDGQRCFNTQGTLIAGRGLITVANRNGVVESVCFDTEEVASRVAFLDADYDYAVQPQDIRFYEL